MVVNSELLREGIKGFGFFGVTPIGLIILLMGVGYMLVARHWLGESRKVQKKSSNGSAVPSVILSAIINLPAAPAAWLFATIPFDWSFS
uniref:Uncharacterized protein n=1 Tax=Yersinia enterocolitica W22703 TaxID=913028 RepID=F4N021_YEREN|nr:hypothetical protein YEW_EE18070 [Yersinia enterocolitica W22703]